MSTLFGKNEYRALIIKSFGQQNNNSFWMIRCQSCQMMTFLIMIMAVVYDDGYHDITPKFSPGLSGGCVIHRIQIS